MNDYTRILTKQFHYFKRVMMERFEKYPNFDKSMREPLFDGEPSALDVFQHGLRDLNYSSLKLVHPNMHEEECQLNIEDFKGTNIAEQLINAFEITIETFHDTETGFSEQDNNMVDTTFEGQQMKLREWLALNIMHTVGHIAQAMRLQGIYLRQASKK